MQKIWPWIFLLWFVTTEFSQAKELPIQKVENKKFGCTWTFIFEKISVENCRHELVLKGPKKEILKTLNLGDDNVRDIRAFSDFGKVLIMVEQVEEENSSLNFYSIQGRQVSAIGMVDVMSENEENSAIENAKYYIKDNGQEFSFRIAIGRVTKKGAFVKINQPLVRVADGKVQLFSGGKPIENYIFEK